MITSFFLTFPMEVCTVNPKASMVETFHLKIVYANNILLSMITADLLTFLKYFFIQKYIFLFIGGAGVLGENHLPKLAIFMENKKTHKKKI